MPLYSATVTNAGVAPTSPTIDIDGPTASSIILRSVTQGRTVTINRMVPSGQTMTVDFATGAVTVAGAAVAGDVQAGSQWWTLEAGANVVQSSEPATTVRFSAAWY